MLPPRARDPFADGADSRRRQRRIVGKHRNFRRLACLSNYHMQDYFTSVVDTSPEFGGYIFHHEATEHRRREPTAVDFVCVLPHLRIYK